jgi:hypothetical protein
MIKATSRRDAPLSTCPYRKPKMADCDREAADTRSRRAIFAAHGGRPKTGQRVGIKQVSDRIWLVTFMDYDLGYLDHETCRLEPLENPFGRKVLPMSPLGVRLPAAVVA